MSKISQWVLAVSERFRKPLVLVEWVLSISNVLVASLVVALEISPGEPDLDSIVSRFISDYEIVTASFIALGGISVINMAFLVGPGRNERYRSYIMMLYSTIYAFLAFLVVLSQGFDHILWINRLTLFWIASILYFSLRAQYHASSD
jgi:hypothetical protein